MINYKKYNLSELIPYENNAKLHPQEQIDQIKESIKQFGFNDPIAVDENNIIIEGNGRYQALKQLQEENYNFDYNNIDCIKLDNLNEEQKKAYILIHNKLTMNTGFDLNILNGELDKIVNIDMSSFDFVLDFDDINCEDYDTDFDLPSDEVPQTRTITLSLSEEQYQIAMNVIDYFNNNDVSHTFGNHNKKSNAIFEAIYLWAEQKKLL